MAHRHGAFGRGGKQPSGSAEVDCISCGCDCGLGSAAGCQRRNRAPWKGGVTSMRRAPARDRSERVSFFWSWKPFYSPAGLSAASRKPISPKNAANGFTLIEVLAAFAIASVIILATAALTRDVALHFDRGTRGVN